MLNELESFQRAKDPNVENTPPKKQRSLEAGLLLSDLNSQIILECIGCRVKNPDRLQTGWSGSSSDWSRRWMLLTSRHRGCNDELAISLRAAGNPCHFDTK